jgi:magnesium transporter
LIGDYETAASLGGTGSITWLSFPRIRFGRLLTAVRRELATGLVLGVLLVAIGCIRILLWQQLFDSYGVHALALASTVSLSLLGAVLWGTIAGSVLPFVPQMLKLDPASASAPLVATLVDVTGLVIYFTVPGVTLRGTLL